MKYLNKYSSWRKINEEISDNKVVDAANKAEEILQPKRADELRMQIVPEFKDPFKFFFFPLSINGDVVTFRAYLDNRESLIKWMHFIHNKINEKLEKPKISLNDFYVSYYEQYKPKDTQLKEYSRWREKIIYILILEK